MFTELCYMKCISVPSLLKNWELKNKREIIFSPENVSYKKMEIYECLSNYIKIMIGINVHIAKRIIWTFTDHKRQFLQTAITCFNKIIHLTRSPNNNILISTEENPNGIRGYKNLFQLQNKVSNCCDLNKNQSYGMDIMNRYHI